MLLATLALCVLFAMPAFGDETESAVSHDSPQAEQAERPDQAEPTGQPEQPPAFDIFRLVHDAVTPITRIDKDALFRSQYIWEAVDTVNLDSANEDGSLSEWQTDWYISHDWSDYGYVIARLEPGDAVTVNGRTILILGREIWPAGSINWDIYDAIGWDKVVFQTCLGDEEIWIAYGIPVNPTEEFLAAHPPQW